MNFNLLGHIIVSHNLRYYVLFGQRSHGEQSDDSSGRMTHKMHELKKQIQGERIVSIKVCFFLLVLFLLQTNCLYFPFEYLF